MTDRCLIVAETGLNHNGSVPLAHAMIDAIADAGADAAKFQCYRTDDFLDRDRPLRYRDQDQYAMFKRCELPDEAWPELQAHCRDRQLLFFATPTSIERLELLVGLGVSLLKNGSDYLGHLPLIRAMAETGIRTLMSVGMATEDEIMAAVGTFRSTRDTGLVLLQCTSTYPTEASDVNLRRIPTLADWYGLPTGFSDHTDGTTAAIGAVALGATVVEKHFTLDRQMDGPDHSFSANRIGLARLVEAIRDTEAMLGSAEIEPAESEQQGRRDYRVTLQDGRYVRG